MRFFDVLDDATRSARALPHFLESIRGKPGANGRRLGMGLGLPAGRHVRRSGGSISKTLSSKTALHPPLQRAEERTGNLLPRIGQLSRHRTNRYSKFESPGESVANSARYDFEAQGGPLAAACRARYGSYSSAGGESENSAENCGSTCIRA